MKPREFAEQYCARQMSEPDELLERLRGQKLTYQPTGWFMLECQQMNSRHFGEYTILPYGPHNTFKDVPSKPVSPRGLASDTSVVVAVMRAEDLQ